MFQAQSHGKWWSAEFRARAIEGRRAVREGRLTWTDVHKALMREFPEEVEKCNLPSEQRVREWERDTPNLPEQMRKKGFLGGFEPLEYQPEGTLVRAEAPAIAPWEVAQAMAASINYMVACLGSGAQPYTVSQPLAGAYNNDAKVFTTLTGYMVACMMLAMWAAMARLVISSL